MRRQRNGGGTKVWHNPELETQVRRGPLSAEQAQENAADKRAVKEHRAALEALFSPRKDPETASGRPGAAAKGAGRIVLTTPPPSDPQTAERQKLLSRLLVAEGRPGISKAADEFLRAGFAFPNEQDVHLQLLEHADEDHVRSAIEVLTSLLVAELPKRRTVLDSRLRRIEQFAEDEATRAAAERLRRTVGGGFGGRTPSRAS